MLYFTRDIYLYTIWNCIVFRWAFLFRLLSIIDLKYSQLNTPMPKTTHSVIWEYFEITPDNKAKCTTCGVYLSRTGGASTSNLKKTSGNDTFDGFQSVKPVLKIKF